MEHTTTALPQMLDEVQVARVLAVSIAALRRWRRRDGAQNSRAWGDVFGTTSSRSSVGLPKTLQALRRRPIRNRQLWRNAHDGDTTHCG